MSNERREQIAVFRYLVLLAVVGVAAVVAIVLFAEDAAVGLQALGATLSPIIAGLLVYQMQNMKTEVREQRHEMNSRLDELKAAEAQVARAEGVAEGRAEHEGEAS